MKRLFLLSICSTALFSFLVLDLLESQTSYQVTEVRNAGTIRGMVRLEGDPLILPDIPITKDMSVCGKTMPNPTLIVGKNKGVKNSVVYLEGITKGKKMIPPANPLLDQVRCQYEPHILIFPEGLKLEIANSDPILHSVHAYDYGKAGATGLPTVFNVALPLKGQRVPKAIPGGAPVLLNLCDTGHPWMTGYVLIVNHPYYAVTDENGNFTLDQVPPGTYTIQMWHEPVLTLDAKSGSHNFVQAKPYVLTKKITVQPGGTAVIDFDLTLKPAS
jgi:hypothetical protein